MIKRPMKGVAVEDFSQIRFPIMGSPKIDGFRCVLKDYPMTSRLSPFPNRHFHKKLTGILPPDRMLDGEVVVGKRRGKGVLQRTSSGLTSEDGKPNFTYWVFDCPLIEGGFEVRYDAAAELVRALRNPRIRLLKHVMIYDIDGLKAYLDRQLARGFEGIYLNTPNGRYKEGKSTLREQFALKVKPFETAEGRIKGWYEEEKNTNEAKREATGKLKRSSAKSGKVAKGQLGGFILEDCKSGVEVRVGGGFTLRHRQQIWADIQREPNLYLGKLVRYKKQTVGEKDKPRHPNFVEFVDFRPEWDFADD